MKLAVIEEGSELAVDLWQEPQQAASSILAYPEGRAALAAARRAARLTPAQHRHALEDFEAICAELLLVSVDESLAQRAGELAEDLALRGYDAVHLATALALGDDTLMVTWDAELSRAALHSGCAVAPAS